MKIKTCLIIVLSFMMVLSTGMLVMADGEAAAPTATPAADAAKNAPSGFMAYLPFIVWILVLVAIGYFLLYRPNKKRRKEEEQLMSSLILGDEITTIGGIVGKIINIKDDNVTIETSIDRTVMEFKKWAIREVKKPISDDTPAEK